MNFHYNKLFPVTPFDHAIIFCFLRELVLVVTFLREFACPVKVTSLLPLFSKTFPNSWSWTPHTYFSLNNQPTFLWAKTLPLVADYFVETTWEVVEFGQNLQSHRQKPIHLNNIGYFMAKSHTNTTLSKLKSSLVVLGFTWIYMIVVNEGFRFVGVDVFH